MNCITRYIYFKTYFPDQENLFEKYTMSTFLQSFLGEDLTDYQLPSDLTTKATTYNRLLSEMMGKYYYKPIGKAYLPPWEDEIPEDTLEKVINSWFRKFLMVLNRTYERYILILDEYASARAKMMDDVKSSTLSKRKHNDTPQNPNTSDVYEGDNYISDFTKFETENNTEFATKMARLNEIEQGYSNVMDDWVDEFQKIFLEEN